MRRSRDGDHMYFAIDHAIGASFRENLRCTLHPDSWNEEKNASHCPQVTEASRQKIGHTRFDSVVGFVRISTGYLAGREQPLNSAKGEITLLLAKWRDGETAAFNELMPLVYPHLREVAAAYIRRERNPDTLQATALVHELYLRLLNQKKAAWEDRRHFYTFAAKVMRMILIDHAHERLTQSRGGNLDRVPLNEELSWVEIGSPELLDLNRALDE